MKTYIQKLSRSNKNPGASRRILMVTHRQLLDDGVAAILAPRTDLDVWGIPDANAYVLARAAVENRPDVLLLFDTDPERQKELIGLLDSLPMLQHLQVVILLLDSYSLDVYSKKRWFQLDGKMFFRVIYGKPLGLLVPELSKDVGSFKHKTGQLTLQFHIGRALDIGQSGSSRPAPEFMKKWSDNLQDVLEIRQVAAA
jgi:hypothetical protein